LIIKYISKFKKILAYIREKIKSSKINLSQRRILNTHYPKKVSKLIVFLTQGKDIVSGGILSITSIYEESIKLKETHKAEVIMCTSPGEPPLLKYTKFENNNYVFGLSQVLSYFTNLEDLMVHIPETYVGTFLENIPKKLFKIRKRHFNIMNQNGEYFPSTSSIERLKKLGKVTCTACYEQDATVDIRNKLGFPIHKLLYYVSPEQYSRKKYNEKKDLIMISPDPHPKKKEVLLVIAKRFPQLKIQIVQDLSYQDYKSLASRAKWSLTFGEGLDGYFAETIFSGGIGFSVYNPIFFTDDFKHLRTVYENYDVLLERICLDMRQLDKENDYSSYQEEQFNICSRHFSYGQYVENLKLFYKEEYTYR
jgi:hypothetical protein